MFSILFTFFIICNLKGYYTMKFIHAEKNIYMTSSLVYYILQKMFFYSDHIVICL